MRIEPTPDKPWRTDPKFGGMTDAAAEKSWRAEQPNHNRREQPPQRCRNAPNARPVSCS
jgi:hypothetical protein